MRRADIGGAVPDHPRILHINVQIEASLLDQGRRRLTAVAAKLQIGSFAGKPAIRMVGTVIDAVDIGTLPPQQRFHPIVNREQPRPRCSPRAR